VEQVNVSKAPYRPLLLDVTNKANTCNASRSYPVFTKVSKAITGESFAPEELVVVVSET